MSFDYPPKGWALCNGQLLPINQNQALFSLLGTMYGGNGQTTFALPDLRGRVPIHLGAGFVQGQTGGAESVTLQGSQMPAHTHIVMATNDLGTSGDPSTLAKASQLYGPPTNQTTLRPDTVSYAGGSQPHENLPAVPGAELVRGDRRHLPEPELIDALRWRDTHVRGQLRARGVGVLQRRTHADLGERGPLHRARHEVRRRRPIDLRATRPRRARARPSGRECRDVELRLGPDRRRRDR